MAKNTFVAYLLWLIGGGFGLHHFYLGRDRHAFTWICTWGGYGLGWIRDFFRIPDYVEDANDEEEYAQNPDKTEEKWKKKLKRARPTFGAWRFLGELCMGWTFAFLARAAVPEELIEDRVMPYRMVIYLVPYAAALGVDLVVGIGRQQGNLKIGTIGAYIPFPLYFYNPSYIGYCTLFSAIAVNWKGRSWRPLESFRKRRHCCRRVGTLLMASLLFYGIWGALLINNAHVTTREGEKIPLKVALKNFFTSPAWAETKATMWRLWTKYREDGWDRVYEEFVVSIDPEGETNAYRVLGLSKSASQADIKQRYHKLAKEWHPDKHTDPQKRAEAAEKFMQIQQAYETLSSIKSKRSQKNTQSYYTHREKDEF